MSFLMLFQSKRRRNAENLCLLFSVVASVLFASQALAYEIDPDATISNSPAGLLGINHIGLSVRDLDASLEFYQAA